MIEKIKVIVKWGAFLYIVAFGVNFLSTFLLTTLGLFPAGYSKTFGFIVGLILALPFYYFFPYKAASEYLRNNPDKWRKNIGLAFGFFVVAFTFILSSVEVFLFTGVFAYKSNIAMLGLGMIAGIIAEKKFLSK